MQDRARANFRPTETSRAKLLRAAASAIGETLQSYNSSPSGLPEVEAERRRKHYGPNRIAHEARGGLLRELISHFINPLNGLLLFLAGVSWALSDQRAAIVISAMVALSVLLAFAQEHRSNAAAAKLRAMVRTHASVRRPEAPSTGDGFVETSLEDLVPGDIVRLSAGDMIPADVRMIEAHDFFVNQSALTGESMPVEKFSQIAEA
ncbi:MAG: cation-transporting P-type ATPase, partial [Methylocystis sp.]|nr:cation-transporting P-type ATPase [Methylocystis sp.]